MQSQTNSVDASGGPNAKRNRDECANNAETNNEFVDEANLSAFIKTFEASKINRPELGTFFKTLRTVKRETIVKDFTQLANMQAVIERKQLAESKLSPSSDPTKSHTPVPLRLKSNELKASKEVRGEQQHNRLQHEANKLTDTYKSDMTKIYQQNAKLEVEAKLKTFRKKFYRNALKWLIGEVLELKQSMKASFRSDLSDRELSGNAFFYMLSAGLNSEYFERLGLDRDSCCAEFTNTFFVRGLPKARDSAEHNTCTLATTLSNGLVLKASTHLFKLLDWMERKKLDKEINAGLKVAYANEEQYEAQNDVRDELTQDKDESMDTEDDTRLGSLLETKMKEAFKPMEEKMKRLEQQNKALQKQLKAKTRQKSSGGGTGHSLNAKSSGHENEKDSPNPSRQQSRKQKQKQRAQRHRNQNRPRQGSGRGGPNKSSERS